MNIDTVRFSHILEANGLYDLNHFLARTAFVISHKSESIETLLGVVWYLPINSPILIITNCPENEKEDLSRNLAARVGIERQVYLIHQKDETVARFFADHDVNAILGIDGKVINGKGEGMYIGALIASLLDYPEWIVFYDADNFLPSALLEYTLAMGRLFMQQRVNTALCGEDIQQLHNIRICWPSKPAFDDPIAPKVMGRCTRTISPLFTELIGEWFGIHDQTIISSNAGEQGFTLQSAQSLHFTSGYSVETFQFLDLLCHAHNATLQARPEQILLQQYQAQSLRTFMLKVTKDISKK